MRERSWEERFSLCETEKSSEVRKEESKEEEKPGYGLLPFSLSIFNSQLATHLRFSLDSPPHSRSTVEILDPVPPHVLH